MLLSRDAILAAADRPQHTVEVPEWGGSVALRPLSVAGRDRFERRLDEVRQSGLGARELHLELVAMSLCDADGQPLFEGPEDLRDKHPEVIFRLFSAALDANGIVAKAVDNAEKNSDATPTDSSASDSPAISA